MFQNNEDSPTTIRVVMEVPWQGPAPGQGTRKGPEDKGTSKITIIMVTTRNNKDKERHLDSGQGPGQENEHGQGSGQEPGQGPVQHLKNLKTWKGFRTILRKNRSSYTVVFYFISYYVVTTVFSMSQWSGSAKINRIQIHAIGTNWMCVLAFFFFFH